MHSARTATCGQLSSAATGCFRRHRPKSSRTQLTGRYAVVSCTCAMTCPSEAITYRSAWGPLAYVSCDGVEIQMARLEPSGCGSTRDRMYPAGPVHNTFPLRQATTVTGWETFPPFVTASDPSQQNPSTRTLSWARRVPSAL